MRRYLLETRGCCESCGITDTYNGKPITLQCDHIDGNNDNNALSNLRLLCPNCHSQTHTWCGRNKKDTKRNNYLREYKAGLAQR
jgi:5-methylcytosine-specific restriction endonuclease McrA